MRCTAFWRCVIWFSGIKCFPWCGNRDQVLAAAKTVGRSSTKAELMCFNRVNRMYVIYCGVGFS